MSTPANRPDPSDNRDWDAEFLAITAHLNDTVDPSAEAVSADESSAANTSRDVAAASEGADSDEGGSDSDTTSAGETTPGAVRFNPQWRMPSPAHDLTASDHAHAAADDDEDDDFVEPEPDPIDWADPYTGIMVGALVLGPLWLIYLVFFHRDASTLTWLVGVGVFVAGFVMAVLRQPHSRDEDDYDDGARV